ncbi:centrosomal protein POC5-like isoform X2 [Carlito syrichta]|uniref:Centrosomal protein POC5 n=1 Tax=Carlito syrichta TaxID=1868482 RepID=A0A3Q0ECL8_CARSF|nr:centrosomal protein POC5-like isoform X2 [Carlito syrichta]
MSSDEKYSGPVVQNESNQGSSVSSDLQVECEELPRCAIVTDPGASLSSHPKGEVGPEARGPAAGDAVLQNPGSSPVLSPRRSSHPVMDFFSSYFFADSFSPATNSSHTEAHKIIVSDFLVSDENLHKMENVLDLWSLDLKTNIISELSKWRLNFIDWHRMEMKKENEKHAAYVKQLNTQINDLKELQKTFGISIGRKDEVISSLSHAIGKQKEKKELMRNFFHWQTGHVKSRQDVYEGKLADHYFQRSY